MFFGIEQWGVVGCRGGGPIVYLSVTKVCNVAEGLGVICSMAPVGCCV